MPPYIIIKKNIGETPLQALERLRVERPELAEVKLAYAGRLDPMASGALLVLIGEECKKVNKYNELNKAYSFELLLGYESDTGDILGLASRHTIPALNTDTIEEAAASFAGTWKMPYPAYSSRPVDGKPLFMHAAEHSLSKITIPSKVVSIYDIKLIGNRAISDADLHLEIQNRISKLNPSSVVEGPANDFRAPSVLEQWNNLRDGAVTHTIYMFQVRVSAGTYIRALAPAIAKTLNTRGLAYNIHRKAIHV